MGTTLTGTTPQDTYDSLIKVTDNGPLSGTAKYLSDGLGNDSALAMSTTAVGIGTASPATSLQVGGTVTSGVSGVANGKFDLKRSSDGLSVANFDIDAANSIARLSTAYSFLTLATEGVERFRITNNGVTFNGDTAAANALDDYEEGTWTMGVSFGNAAAGITTSSNTGTYTKVGRQVTVNGYLALTSKGSSTGVAKITGLPFTIANSNANTSVPSLWFNVITFVNQFQGYGEIGLTTIRLQESTSLGVASDLTDVDFADNSGIIVGFTYFV
jgi:hypothetical protein